MEELESCIDGALDQSFFCLYGLNMNPDSTSEEDLVTHQNTSRGDYQTKEQCADVFHYILPYAKTLSVCILLLFLFFFFFSSFFVGRGCGGVGVIISVY